MSEWQYYLTGSTPDLADEGRAGMIRVPLDGPVSLAEQVQSDGSWDLTGRLWRMKYEGAEDEVTEIESARAEQVIRTWVEIGRLDALPSNESSIDPDVAERLVEADRQVAARWQAVQPPPGVEDITF